MKTISPRLLALTALLLAPLAALHSAELLASEAVEKTRDDLERLAFSDPANVTPMPAWAVGQASRAPDLDALPGFQKPPAGFGVVPFFWWLGDPLTKERLGWILKQMDGMGIASYQINYAHSDKGRTNWFGLTIPSDPPLFSEEWWKLVGWFMQAAKKQGSAVSLNDYTLGPGQGWCFDAVLREHPELIGMVLRQEKDGKVSVVTVPGSLNPMHPLAGKLYAEKFFGEFERRNPGEGGKGLNFFFSDELTFGVSGHLWSSEFAEEFKKRKGYDITPELPSLFKDIGPRTPKVRMDYSNVMVSLTEEGYFKPIFDWHQQRGMTMGCDHGGRGRRVDEFGDYFRTQRWMQGPGADQPNLGKSLIKAKVASSMAHLYLRPRVWLEGFYGSGWGTTSAGFVDATFTDFMMGYNLLAFHGMYYATHGGWWEWAPPDNTFRMPYWKHMRGFMDCVQRLAYLFTQGHHRCDVAILYPVAPMEAGMDGAEAVKTAFTTGEQLYAKGVDFDFIDFESLARAKVVGKELHVSGEMYRVLILPAMKAVRYSTLQKALEFHRAGGIVLAVGALPEASDRVGRDDPEVAAMVKELFPGGPTNDVFAKLPG
ncbi:MAG: glycosyl hydrolase, partial [Candidatus Hydrogenedentes bacterium]|nr:glycosyl hydrolase [Candidatus Hydrogenedentota bacterium]